MGIEAFYKNFTEQLRTIYDTREADNIADWVFESIANIKRSDRITHKQKQLNNSTIEQLNNALQQLLQHKPVQYVLNEVWFYKMRLKVNEHVLIPRPETEELVSWAVEEIRNKKSEIRNKEVENPTGSNSPVIAHRSSLITRHSSLPLHDSPFTILDIGTGSGCIAVALKKESPGTDITANDVSANALIVAKENAADQNTQINFLQFDFLDETSWESLPSFDIIVSNPPYIPEDEKTKLAENVTGYEPHLALFVKDNDPFIFYKKIAAFAEKHLNVNGKVFVEVHEDYSKEVQQVFTAKNFSTEIRKDIYGRNRMIKAFPD